MGVEIESRLLGVELASSDDEFRSKAKILDRHGIAGSSHDPQLPKMDVGIAIQAQKPQ